jgi:hypothetical protein
MMHDVEHELEFMISKHAPRLQTGDLLFSQRRAIARAMLKAMSDEMMRIDAQRAGWDEDRCIREELRVQEAME